MKKLIGGRPRMKPLQDTGGRSVYFQYGSQDELDLRPAKAPELSSPSSCPLVVITFLRAINLPKTDMNGLSDPYCQIKHVENDGRMKKFKTPTAYKTLNPVWNARIELLFPPLALRPLPSTIHIKVKDRDMLKDDFVGNSYVVLRDIGPEPIEQTLAISSHPSAKLYVTVHLEERQDRPESLMALAEQRIRYFHAKDLMEWSAQDKKEYQKAIEVHKALQAQSLQDPPIGMNSWYKRTESKAPVELHVSHAPEAKNRQGGETSSSSNSNNTNNNKSISPADLGELGSYIFRQIITRDDFKSETIQKKDFLNTDLSLSSSPSPAPDDKSNASTQLNGKPKDPSGSPTKHHHSPQRKHTHGSNTVLLHDMDLDHKDLTHPDSICNEVQIRHIIALTPARFHFCKWRLMYRLTQHGASLRTFYTRVEQANGLLIIIKDNTGRVFGSFTTKAWLVGPFHFGSGENFVFTTGADKQPVAYRWSYQNEYFQMAKDDWLAVGGGGDGAAIQIDKRFHSGTSGACETFRSPVLSGEKRWTCIALEAWEASLDLDS